MPELEGVIGAMSQNPLDLSRFSEDELSAVEQAAASARARIRAEQDAALANDESAKIVRELETTDADYSNIEKANRRRELRARLAELGGGMKDVINVAKERDYLPAGRRGPGGDVGVRVPYRR